MSIDRTSDILAAIESKAEWIEQDGKALADFVARLAIQRSFTTKAELAMDDAELALLKALEIVRACHKHFINKPKEPERTKP